MVGELVNELKKVFMDFVNYLEVSLLVLAYSYSAAHIQKNRRSTLHKIIIQIINTKIRKVYSIV